MAHEPMVRLVEGKGEEVGGVGGVIVGGGSVVGVGKEIEG